MVLLAWLGDRLVGVASYELAGESGIAEVAFAVPDDMHGKGIATLLLEHLVSVARDRGVRAFTAETLAENAAMLKVFADAGLPVRRRLSAGVVELAFPLPGEADPGLDQYLDQVAARESRADVASLQHLLWQASVAVVGASRRRGTVGREILHNIVTGGFSGQVYPVNPRAAALDGLRCLASVDDLPATRGHGGDRGPGLLPFLMWCSGAGGAASGLWWSSLQVLATGVPTFWPSAAGTACGWSAPTVSASLSRLSAWTRPSALSTRLLAARAWSFNPAASASRCSGTCPSSVSGCRRSRRSATSTTCQATTSSPWWEHDPRTKLAVLYVESYGSPRKFARTARRVGQRMPVLTVLGGRSMAGQRAAASHTAAAATPLVTQEALFAQAGIIAVPGLGELVEATALLASQPLPAGNRIAIVSNAGGAGVLAADACEDNGLRVAVLSRSHAAAARASCCRPARRSRGPVDTTAAVAADPFRSCLEEVAADDGVDALLVVTVPTAIADLTQAVTTAKVSKPLAAAVLDQPQAVRLIPVDDHETSLAGGDFAALQRRLRAPECLPASWPAGRSRLCLPRGRGSGAGSCGRLQRLAPAAAGPCA